MDAHKHNRHQSSFSVQEYNSFARNIHIHLASVETWHKNKYSQHGSFFMGVNVYLLSLSLSALGPIPEFRYIKRIVHLNK